MRREPLEDLSELAPAAAEAPWIRPEAERLVRLRRKLGAAVVDNFFLGSSRFFRALPISRPGFHRVEVQRDLAYLPTGASYHLLDVYRPVDAERRGPLPIVLYIHGGGFRILSKDTHWLFGLAFARRGYLVFNINYRLAPKHPFPAAVWDASDAFQWVVRNAETFGGDLSRVVIAGESAGANLATTIALASCYRRDESFAKAVFDTGVVPKAVFAACGMLQVSDPERFLRRKRLPSVVHDRIAEVADAYFHQCSLKAHRELDLADPLVLLERGERPERPLPAFFAPCGTSDPLLDDTRRLAAALEKLGGRCAARYYPGEMHAFHAFMFRRHARECWRELFQFLDAELAPGRLFSRK